MDWNSLALVGLGGLLGILPGFVAQRVSVKAKKRAVAAAFAAEIEATVTGPEKRGLLEHFEGFVEDWKRGERLDERPGFIGVDKIEQDFPVYHSHIGKVGDLGPELAKQVVMFYATIISIRHDIVAIQNVGRENIEWVKALISEDLELWREASASGKRLIVQLQEIAA